MNLSLLAPLGLAALAALLLPLLLHLARRTPQRRTEFAALRWLAARLRPRRRLRIEEPWLLLLRLLLVASVALLFARPVWNLRDAGTPWVLVHPTLEVGAARAALADAEDADWHWLAPGFPALDAPPPAGTAPISSLLREADARLPTGTPLSVLVPRMLDGLDAERPRLARKLRWIVLPTTAPPVPAPAAGAPQTISLRGADDAAGRRFLLAAARANGWRAEAAATDAAPPTLTTPVLWLDAQAPPPALLAWVRRGGTLWLAAEASPMATPEASIIWRDEAGEPVASRRTLGRGRVLQWRRPLRPESLPLLLEPGFARELAERLEPPTPDPARADADALRPRSGASAYTPLPRPLDTWLAWLAIALFALERVAATRPGRAAGA